MLYRDSTRNVFPYCLLTTTKPHYPRKKEGSFDINRSNPIPKKYKGSLILITQNPKPQTLSTREKWSRPQDGLRRSAWAVRQQSRRSQRAPAYLLLSKLLISRLKSPIIVPIQVPYSAYDKESGNYGCEFGV